MHGLSQIHLSDRGVAFKVKMAEDVLYNEVSQLIRYINFDNTYIHVCMQAMVYLLEEQYSIEYSEGVSCHQHKTYPMLTK